MEFITATFQAALLQSFKIVEHVLKYAETLEQSDKIVEHVRKYVVNHSAQIDELREAIKQLEEARSHVQHNIEAAKKNLQEEDADDLEKWSDGANKMIEEANKIISEHGAKMMCCNGWCPNLISRYRLSKKACQKKVDLEKYKEKDLTKEVNVVGGRENALSTRGYMEFKSRESVCDKVMGALKDGKAEMIGVFGMAGSGKTMLVKNVAKQAKQEGLFDEVIVTAVSETPDFEKIQEEIARNLGLTLEVNQDRTDRLCKRLKDEKKTLIILDDVWKRSELDMKALGISFGNDQKGCKLLLTSRDQCVLSNDLKIEEIFIFKVNPLEPGEAKSLFMKGVGNFDPKFQKTVDEAVAECGGVPLAITTVAKALRKESPDHWSSSVQKWQKSKSVGMYGPHDAVSSAIKLSYDYLESKEEQLLFLLCSLHAEDQEINIDNLLRYGVGYVPSDIYDVGLGVFQGAYTMEQARDSLNASIKSLKDCCLLLDGNDGGTIKMHDVTRDAAIKIAKKKFIFIVKEALDLERRSKSKDLIGFSLPYGYVSEHLERLICPQLKLFFLFNHKNSLQIPNGFFEEMKELSVLSLNGIRLSLHDSSLRFLQNLQTLCLVGCKLDNIAVIGKLKDLKVLSLAWSNVKWLPKEIGNLHRLQLLDLGNCSQLQVIESYALSGLKRLNELYIENSFKQWEVEEQNASGNASVSELNHLSHLTTLNLHIPNARIVPDALCFKNLVRYKILIGDNWDWTNTGFEISTLKININGSFQLEDGIKTLLKKCEVLCLGEMKGVDKIQYRDCEGFPKLKYLDIKTNADIQYIICSKELRPIAFPVLESMFLRNMIKLEKIFYGDIETGFSHNLRKVSVEGCDSLKFVFYVSKTMLRLQEMVIYKCKEMDAVVKRSEHEIETKDYTMEFAQLRILELRFLPNLSCFNFDSESFELFDKKV
ncbi:disease resistance protein At4g27190-like [Quercus robur]|uniref:disease resistance protein At4g27190-like n=1 Tax=Quercus robur TaxID=38942 RepID=UPI002163B804|nr:disease resistance protein At4g27190-like [Quercus robur]